MPRRRSSSNRSSKDEDESTAMSSSSQHDLPTTTTTRRRRRRRRTAPSHAQVDWRPPPPPAPSHGQVDLSALSTTTSTSTSMGGHWRPPSRTTSLAPSHVGQEVFDEELEAYIDEYRKSILPGEDPSGLEYFVDGLRINGIHVGHRYIPSAPFFELHSVEIFLDTERSCCIYGEISLTDGRGNSIVLYKKNEDEAEWLENGEELSLAGCVTIAPLNYFKVSVSLLDKNLDSIYVANRSFNIELSTSDSWRLNHKKVYGNCGYVTIYYRSILAAVVADFSVTLYKELSDTGDNGAQIYGIIRARRDPPFKNSVGSKFDLTLFEKDEDESVRVEYGEVVELSRDQLIVPTCSSLSLALKFFDYDSDCIIIRGVVKLKAFHPLTVRHEVWSEDRNWLVVVDVDWSLWDNVFDKYEIPKIDELSLAPHPSCYSTSSMLVEIYSISINHGAETDEYVGGNITVRDDDGVFYVFKEDGVVPNICLWWPSRCLKAVRFRMNLKLNYREGITACHGYLILSYQPKHLNKRLCSVIRSDLSFVTIHYSVFTRCLQGNLFIQLVSPGSVPMDVDGSIVAQTSNFEKTSYNMTYYRNVLFKVPDQTTYYCESESRLPLRKSAIVGPIGDSVIITSDVVVYKALARYKAADLCGEMKFKVGMDKTRCMMSEGYRLIVTIKWVNV